METFDERLDRFIKHIHDNYTVEDVTVFDMLRNGISYLATHINWETDWGFAHIIYKALLENTRLGISEDEVWDIWMEVICHDAGIIVKSTGQDYDFIATLEIDKEEYDKEHQNYDRLTVNFFGDYEDLEPIKLSLPPGKWIGLLADEEGYRTLEAIKEGKFYTEWEEDY